jgi:hypothetical protein
MSVLSEHGKRTGEGNMNGQELIDYIQQNCHLEKEFYIKDGNGNLFSFKGVDVDTKRDPYDGDFDQSVNVIELYGNCVIKEE